MTPERVSRMKSKTFKKLITSAMAAVLVLCCSVAAYADEGLIPSGFLKNQSPVIYVMLALLLIMALITAVSSAKTRKLRNRLENAVSMRTSELQEKNQRLNRINEDIVGFLGEVVEARDMESGAHVKRVKKLSYILAKEVMKQYPEYGLSEDKIRIISSASALHDIGKIMIPDAILLKPGKLTPEEYEIMKTHCVRGCELLEQAPSDWSREYIGMGLDICHYHHEKYDGKGYPDGLVGDEIPISAQIVSVADMFDALVTERVYKKAKRPEEAYQMIVNDECGVISDKMKKCLLLCKDSFEQLARNPELDVGISKSQAQTAEISLRGINILIAEDNDLNREITTEILEEKGANVTEAVDGQECLDLFNESAPHYFDAVLMDIEMPNMNGVQATKGIRNSKRIDFDVPVIAMTADNSAKTLDEALEAGMSAYLTKPLSAEAFSQVLLQLLQDRIEVVHNELATATDIINKDPLTGVKSKSAYTAICADLDEKIGSGQCSAFAMIVCDVNNLKTVNDAYGHDVGDKYLNNCGNVLRTILEGSEVCRIGGDEFAAILTGENYENREKLFSLLKNKGSGGLNIQDIQCGKASFAAGMSVFDAKNDRSVRDVFTRADNEMYAEKAKR